MEVRENIKSIKIVHNGSVLWILFDIEAERLEKTWDVSQRLMFSLHHETHRFFIEPLSESKHIMLSLYKRFIKFTQKLSQSRKAPLRNLYSSVKYDGRSTTGSNLRQVMLRLGVCQPDDLDGDIIGQAKYKDIPAEDEWKIQGAKDLIEAKHGRNILPNLSTDEIEVLLDNFTT